MCGKTLKQTNTGIHCLKVFDNRTPRLATVPSSFKKEKLSFYPFTSTVSGPPGCFNTCVGWDSARSKCCTVDSVWLKLKVAVCKHHISLLPPKHVQKPSSLSPTCKGTKILKSKNTNQQFFSKYTSHQISPQAPRFLKPCPKEQQQQQQVPTKIYIFTKVRTVRETWEHSSSSRWRCMSLQSLERIHRPTTSGPGTQVDCKTWLWLMPI